MSDSFPGKGNEVVPVNLSENFFEKLSSIPSIKRDDYLDTLLNTVIHGKGTFLRSDALSRYGMDSRIILSDKEALKYKMNIHYYLFVKGNKKNIKISKNEIKEFQGVFSAYTPLNTARSDYVFDIIINYDKIKSN